jgi:hypothetical protein
MRRLIGIEVAAFIRCLGLVGLIGLLAFLAFLSSTYAWAAPKTEWILDQKHHDIGRTRVYVADDAIKIVNLGRGIEIVAKGPQWKVVVSRPREKLAYTTNPKGFEQFSVFGPLGWAATDDKMPSSAVHEQSGDLHFSKCLTSGGATFAWSIDDIHTTTEAQKIYQQYYQTPLTCVLWKCSATGKVKSQRQKVDSFTWVKDAGLNEIKDWLSTQKCVQAAYNAADFQYPQGFKPVKTQSEILISSSKDAELTNVLEDLGMSGSGNGTKAATRAATSTSATTGINASTNTNAGAKPQR